MNPTTATVRSLTGSEREGFFTFYGVPVIETGEAGESLLALGHPKARRLLAALNAFHRSVGHRLVLCEDLIPHAVTRTWGTVTDDESGTYAWVVEEASSTRPGAQPVTWIDQGALDYEDAAVQEQCPRCDHPSRSTTYGGGPGRRTVGPHHTCRACAYRWPAAPVRSVSLWKPPREPALDECFACWCGPGFACTKAAWPGTARCSGVAFDATVGHPMCGACRAQLPEATWRELAAAGYGTARPHLSIARQRDLWLMLRTRDGLAPAVAAREWEQRLALTAQRAS